MLICVVCSCSSGKCARGSQGPHGNPGEVSNALGAAHGCTSANRNGVATLDTPLADPDR